MLIWDHLYHEDSVVSVAFPMSAMSRDDVDVGDSQLLHVSAPRANCFSLLINNVETAPPFPVNPEKYRLSGINPGVEFASCVRLRVHP